MDDGAPLGRDEINQILEPLRHFRRLLLAVSGGADSTGLLHLVHGWLPASGLIASDVLVVTVDHRLRPGSANEAAEVARQVRPLGFEHQVCVWAGPHPASGLQDAAREARYDLLHAAATCFAPAAEPNAVAIVTAHTADDQAETLLMRLARGSGVDGLAGIPAVGRVIRRGPDAAWRGIAVVRPLLSVGRDRLVATLDAARVSYVEDPSNRDRRFERVRVREALAVLAPLGVTRTALARTAERMQRARAALEAEVSTLEATAVGRVLGLVIEIDAAAFAAASAEVGVRLLRRLVARVGGTAAAAELRAVEAAHARLAGAASVASIGFTIGGCIIAFGARRGANGPRILIYREPDRHGGLASVRLEPGQSALWDGRCHVTAAPEAVPVEIGPLGPDWGDLAIRFPVLAGLRLPTAAVRGIPAIRAGGVLVAVPLLADWARENGDEAAAVALDGPRSKARESAERPFVRQFGLSVVDW